MVLQPGDWPGFRGPERDGRRTGVRIATNWNERPPRQLWRQRIGPGWSSFAVVAERLYNSKKEQRGPQEAGVVCYDAGDRYRVVGPTSGQAARFTETMGELGPRATPTFHDGKVYAQGATGKLNCLDAVSGQVLWSRVRRGRLRRQRAAVGFRRFAARAAGRGRGFRRRPRRQECARLRRVLGSAGVVQRRREGQLQATVPRSRDAWTASNKC